MKFKFLSRTIFKKQNIKMLNDMDTHITTEGENMKNILENYIIFSLRNCSYSHWF
jgi:hypothetical protein